MRNKSKHDLKAVIRKIFAAFALVSVAIIMALAIARFSFKELMGTVNKLSAPNGKLAILNSVFEEITTLDQVQRAEAIKNPHKTYDTFLEQSASVGAMIDSLKTLSWDSAQLIKLNEMNEILNERNELFFSYLKVKAELLDNKEFSVQLDTLAAIIQNDQLAIDSSLITTQTKTTTTYLQDTTALKKSEQRSLIRKLFSRKKTKQPVDTPKIKVEQQLSVVVDTMAVARQNEALKQVELIMREMETDQRTQRRKLQQQELELINANGLFVNQLLSILHEVEKEELQQMRNDNAHAVSVMNQSISRTNILMLGFFVGAAILVYLILIDVSKSNYYKEQLEKARDEAEQLSQIKQRFLANMSHELRTPLQSIIGFAEQLKQNSSENQEEVEAIYSSSEHLLHIVNEVLDYSRISSGNFTLANERFKILAVIKEVEAAMRIQAEHKNLTFIVDSEKAMDYTLMGDPFRLKQILYNVIGNAIKFTHKGFIKLAIKTNDDNHQIRTIFEITDTGIGIERDDIDRIFNQFEQANASITKNYGGTGLGLTIVKALIDAQHGSLELSSNPGAGTTFRIELRFERATPVVTSKTHHVPLTQTSPSPFKGKVLVIDDDALILRLCSLILKKNRVEVITFTKPTTLLQQAVDPDVTHVFLDIRMPEINGVDLCKALKKKYHHNVQFVALTAHVLPEERKTLIDEGFDAVLPKPFHEHELLGTLGITVTPASNEEDDQPDFSLLKKMTMGDEALFQSIIVQFVEETREDLIQIKNQLTAENEKAMREIVHKMAGRFAQLGITNLASKLQLIEKQLVAGEKIPNLSADITNIAKKVSDLIARIRVTAMEQLNQAH